jgi:hypothetical protein
MDREEEKRVRRRKRQVRSNKDGRNIMSCQVRKARAQTYGHERCAVCGLTHRPWFTSSAAIPNSHSMDRRHQSQDRSARVSSGEFGLSPTPASRHPSMAANATLKDTAARYVSSPSFSGDTRVEFTTDATMKQNECCHASMVRSSG